MRNAGWRIPPNKRVAETMGFSDQSNCVNSSREKRVIRCSGSGTSKGCRRPARDVTVLPRYAIEKTHIC
jgi:hypothetical protein